jgi:hypothetical protein
MEHVVRKEGNKLLVGRGAVLVEKKGTYSCKEGNILLGRKGTHCWWKGTILLENKETYC